MIHALEQWFKGFLTQNTILVGVEQILVGRGFKCVLTVVVCEILQALRLIGGGDHRSVIDCLPHNVDAMRIQCALEFQPIKYTPTSTYQICG